VERKVWLEGIVAWKTSSSSLEFFVVEYPEGKEGKEKEMARKKGGGKELTIPTKREGTAKKTP
jgi:hypothetical protein